MTKRKKLITGGFVALNSGEIADCYSDITVHGKRYGGRFFAPITPVL